jgi:hypothetical protein
MSLSCSSRPIAPDDTVYIPLRVIATKNDDVVKLIIRGTNRQTKVEDDQFFALTDFAEQLEAYFQTFPDVYKLYYERRSGQYSRLAIQNTRVVTHRNLVRAMGAMFLGVPDEATRRYKTLKGRIGKDIFAKGHKLDPYYVAAFAWYKLDVNFRTQRISAKLKVARLLILLAMRYLANPTPMPQKNAHEMERYCRQIIEILWDAAKADDLCARAAILVEEVAENRFDRDTIRTQSFTEKVIDRCEKDMSVYVKGKG